MVLIDPDYVKERKVYGHVLAAFRYGREDLDVLGLTFRKDLYLASEQVNIDVASASLLIQLFTSMSILSRTDFFRLCLKRMREDR